MEAILSLILVTISTVSSPILDRVAASSETDQVFSPKEEHLFQLRKYPKDYDLKYYTDFCVAVLKSGVCSDFLPYEKYAGKKFYFLAEYEYTEPYSIQSFKIRKVVFEDGTVGYLNPMSSSIATQVSPLSYLPYFAPGSYEYDPQGNDEFVFYGEDKSASPKSFCTKTSLYACLDDLSEYNLFGVRGYVDEYIVRKKGDIVAKVQLENGMSLFYVNDVDLFESGSGVISLEYYNKVQNWSQTALTEGSEIVLSELIPKGDIFYYKLSNGRVLSESSLKGIRKLSSKNAKHVKLAEELSLHDISYDEFTDIAVVNGLTDEFKSTVYLKFTFYFESGEASYSVIYRTFDEQCHRFNRIIRIIGENSWKSEISKNVNSIAKQDYCEFQFDFLTRSQLPLLMVKKANSLKVRIYGKSAHHDFNVSDQGLESIIRMIKIFGLVYDKTQDNIL